MCNLRVATLNVTNLMFKSWHAIMYSLCFVAVVCGQLTKGPENVAVLVGSDVTLRCAGTRLSWEDYVTDPGGLRAISNEADVYFPNEYNLITEPTGTYDLTIKSIQLKQGGRYRCKALLEPSYIYVQVITFSGETLFFSSLILLFLGWFYI